MHRMGLGRLGGLPRGGRSLGGFRDGGGHGDGVDKGHRVGLWGGGENRVMVVVVVVMMADDVDVPQSSLWQKVRLATCRRSDLETLQYPSTDYGVRSTGKERTVLRLSHGGR